MHSPLVIAKNYIDIGISKVRLTVFKMLAMGIFAGMFVALSCVGATVAAAVVDDPGLGRILYACVFPAGLIMVLIAGGELWTGNNLIIICVLEKRVSIKEMLKNWSVVFIGNFIGTIIIATFVVFGSTPALFGGKVAEHMVQIAIDKVGLSFMEAFIQGILCNILVCCAVWMSFAAKKVEGKMMIAYMPIMIFVLCGFEQSVANMYLILAGIFTAYDYGIVATELTLVNFLWGNIIPVSLGNIVGGAGILGFMAWAIFLRITPGTHDTIEHEQKLIDHAEEY